VTIFNWDITTPVHEIIPQAIGAASMCWEHPEGAGVFDSERASEIGEELLDILKKKLWVQDE
jgi:hypothetical protein